MDTCGADFSSLTPVAVGYLPRRPQQRMGYGGRVVGLVKGGWPWLLGFVMPRKKLLLDAAIQLVLNGCFRHQLLLPRPYLVLTIPLRLDIQCQRGASVKIGWKYLDD